MTLRAEVLGEGLLATPQHLLQNWAAWGGMQDKQGAHHLQGRRAHHGVTLQNWFSQGTSSCLSLASNKLLGQGAPKCRTILASYHSTAFCHHQLIHTYHTVHMMKCFTACSLSTRPQLTTTWRLQQNCSQERHKTRKVVGRPSKQDQMISASQIPHTKTAWPAQTRGRTPKPAQSEVNPCGFQGEQQPPQGRWDQAA